MSSILENTAFVVQSVIKTEKLELSLTLTCSMREEKQTARIVIPRDQKMKDHPAYEFGLKLLTGKIPLTKRSSYLAFWWSRCISCARWAVKSVAFPADSK